MNDQPAYDGSHQIPMSPIPALQEAVEALQHRVAYLESLLGVMPS